MSAYKPKIRLYIKSNIVIGEHLSLDKKQTHYIANVMRQIQGNKLYIFNEISGEFIADIVSSSKNEVIIKASNQTKSATEPNDIWLCFAPVKNAPVSFIVQKATELGITKLFPVITEHTIVRKVNLDKMHLTVIEAAEQCGRISLPKIAPETKLQTFIREFPSDRKLIYCDESGRSLPIIAQLKNLNINSKLAILIGPEGGFTEKEYQLISSQKYACPVSLGPRILRADTAAIAATSCVMSVLGDWK